MYCKTYRSLRFLVDMLRIYDLPFFSLSGCMGPDASRWTGFLRHVRSLRCSMPPYVTSRGTRCFSTSPLLRALPPAIQESTLFHDVMSQSFKDARMHLEPKSDETFMGDYWVLKKDGSVSKVPESHRLHPWP